MFGRGIQYSVFLLVGLSFFAVSGSPQVVTGTISGRVADSTGAVIPGATVEIQNVGTGLTRNVETDASGRYEVRNLPVGSYSITVQQAGFRTEVRRGITLTVASEAVVNFALTVGEVQERVEVTAEAPAIETTTATMSGLVGQDQIRDLPLDGRNLESLFLLAPGVIYQAYGSKGMVSGNNTLSSAGARPDANNFMLDGSTINDHSNAGSSSIAGLQLGVEAVREFRVLTHNFSAEYGRSSGAIVSSVTRSGTNEFHGSAYHFLRNNKLDARNFFNVTNAPAPSPLPPFKQNQFGVSLGGPVVRDRIFFFANYEGYRKREGITQVAIVPDENMRKGLLPNPRTGQLEQFPIHPAIVPWMNLYPLPNGRNFGVGTAEYFRDVGTSTNEDYGMGRLDYQLSENDSFYIRYVQDPATLLLEQTIPLFAQKQISEKNYAVINETHLFSPTMLNEFRLAFNRTIVFRDQSPRSILDGALDFVPGAGTGSLSFQAQADSGAGSQLQGLGGSTILPQGFPQNSYQVSDALSYVQGNHAWKFGFSAERLQTGTRQLRFQQGDYQFGSLTEFLAATPRRLTIAFVTPTVNPVRGWRHTIFGWFVQDDFRVRPNLTLNLGFRHEFSTERYEVNGRSSNLRNLTDEESILGPPFQTPKMNFAPRVGIAWDPFGTGKTSVRMGSGIYHNILAGRVFNTRINADYRFAGQASVRNPRNFPDVLRGGTLQPAARQTEGADWDLKEPVLYHWSLEIQQQLTGTISVRAGYVGSHGSNLPVSWEPNIRTPEIINGEKYFSLGAPFLNPSFSKITRLSTASNSNYNALQLAVNKSLSAGLLFQANYSWSRNLSDGDTIGSNIIGSSGGSTMDPTDRSRDYGLSAYGQKHTFILNSRYQAPFGNWVQSRAGRAILGGWEFSGIYRAGSGFPVNMLTGFNASQNGDVTLRDRPDLKPGFSNNPTRGVTAGCDGVVPAGQRLGTPDLWFDPCAFELPPYLERDGERLGRYGNMARNTIIGPGQWNVDFTVARNFPVTERINLGFRTEFFNLFNHAQFGPPPAGPFTSDGRRRGGAGRIDSTVNDNRKIQFGLRMTF